MEAPLQSKNLLGINSLGRIGKLTLWGQLGLRHFDGFVVNVGRDLGKGIDAVIQTIESDSTYGSLCRFLYGYSKPELDVRVIDGAAVSIHRVEGEHIVVKTLCEVSQRIQMRAR